MTALASAAVFFNKLFSLSARLFSRRVIEVDALTGFIFAVQATRFQHGLHFRPVFGALGYFCVGSGAIFLGAAFFCFCFSSGILAGGGCVALPLDPFLYIAAIGAVIRKLQALLGRRSGRPIFVMYVTFVVGPFINLVSTHAGADGDGNGGKAGS